MKTVTLCIVFAIVSANLDRRRRYHDTLIDYFNGNCSEARLQQLQDWIPEGCPSIKYTNFHAASPNEYCNARCAQYLYESINECYGEKQAFVFEQECSVVNATGTHCYMVALSLDIGTHCNALHFNDTYCSPTCSNYVKSMYETHGCCLFVAVWLAVSPMYVGSERETIARDDLSNCNISADFCPASFSKSMIGVPPIEVIQTTVNIGLITGLTILAVVLVTFLILILLLAWLRIRKQKHSEWQVYYIYMYLSLLTCQVSVTVTFCVMYKFFYIGKPQTLPWKTIQNLVNLLYWGMVCGILQGVV